MHGTDLDPPHICGKWTPWSLCGTSNSRSGGCLLLYCLPLDLFTLMRYLCLASVEGDTPSPTRYAKVDGYPWGSKEGGERRVEEGTGKRSSYWDVEQINQSINQVINRTLKISLWSNKTCFGLLLSRIHDMSLIYPKRLGPTLLRLKSINKDYC